MTITVEILNDETLKLLKNLEQLKLLRLKLPSKQKAKQKVANVAVETPSPKEMALSAFEAGIIKPLRKDLTLQELLKEQNFKGFDRQEMDRLAKEVNIQEPIGELLAMLKP
jgi:hypothetical protein